MKTGSRIRFSYWLSALLWLTLSIMSMRTEAAPNKVINIVTESWRPYVFVNEDGSIGGKLKDRVLLVLDEADVLYQMDIYPWPRAYRQALDVRNTLIFPIIKTQMRTEQLQFVCPLAQPLELYLVKLSSRTDIQIKSLDDAKQYTIGLVRDDHDHEFLSKRGFEDNIHLDTNVDDLSSLRKLIKGRIDLMIQSKTSLADKIEQLDVRPNIISFEYKVDLGGESEICMAFSTGTPKNLVQKVQGALDTVNESHPLIDLN